MAGFSCERHVPYMVRISREAIDTVLRMLDDLSAAQGGTACLLLEIGGDGMPKMTKDMNHTGKRPQRSEIY